MIFIYLI